MAVNWVNAALFAARGVVETVAEGARVLRLEHRGLVSLLRGASRIHADADELARCGIDRSFRDSVGSAGGVRGSETFGQLRARYTTEAHRRLHADPDAAARIGLDFRVGLHQAYLRTRPVRHRSAADTMEVAKKAQYEAVRACHAVVKGFYFDVPIRRACDVAHNRMARGEAVDRPELSPNAGLRRCSVFDEDVQRRWYAAYATLPKFATQRATGRFDAETQKPTPDPSF